MKKSIMAFALVTTLAFGSMVSYASVIPPQGPGQIGLSSVVLCDSLSLHSSPDFESETTQTLSYEDKPIVINQSDGWAQVVLGDSEDSPSGWVSADFIAVDPAWYQTEEETPVYAWNDTSAPKVALLDAGTTLPILKDNGDWLVVSLRGAAGWISNPDRAASQNNTANTNTANTNTANTNSTQTAQNKPANGANEEKQGESENPWITVYARDGSTASIRLTSGNMYEDTEGVSYVKQDSDSFFYCTLTDVKYAIDPTQWTGEFYGENEFPNEVDDTTYEDEDQDTSNGELTGEDYGENQDTSDDELTGEDYGENQGDYDGWMTGEDYGENQDA